MRTIRNSTRGNFAAAIICGVVYYGFYTRSDKRFYFIETNTPIWLKDITFFNSDKKPKRLIARLVLGSMATLLVVPIWSLWGAFCQLLRLLLLVCFYNVIHNGQRPWWDDRLAGLQSLTITIYAIIISWLYFKN